MEVHYALIEIWPPGPAISRFRYLSNLGNQAILNLSETVEAKEKPPCY